MLRIALRTVLAHKLRLALTTLSAILGAAFVAGMLMLTAALDNTFTAIISGSAQDVVVTRASALDDPGTSDGPGGGFTAEPIPERVVTRVADVAGVAAAAGTVTTADAYLLTPDGDVVGGKGPPALGLTWLSDPDLATATITSGRAPNAPDEIVVDEGTAETMDVALDATVRMSVSDELVDMRLVGVARYPGGGFGGLTLTAFTPERAQELFGRPDSWDTVVVATTGERDDATVAAQISRSLGSDYLVQTRAEQIDSATSALRQGLGFVTTILSVFAGIALFVAAFLIFNTFSMIVARRSRELALLRAVGAMRRQILAAVVTEALAVGLVAGVSGVLLGYLLAQGLAALLGRIGLDLAAGLALTPGAAGWALSVAVGVTVLSALLPAWRASRTRPVEAMRGTGPYGTRVSLWRALLGAVALAAGAYGIVRALGSDLDAAGTGYAAAAVVIGVILLGPALARGTAALIAGVFGLIGGVPGRIAARNAGRTPARVAATASALMIGLALVSGVSVIVSSAQASVNQLVDRSFIGDILVTSDGRPFSPDLADRIAATDGVGLVVQQTSGPAEWEEARLTITALGLQGGETLLADLQDGQGPPLPGGQDPSGLPGLGITDLETLISGRAVVSESAIERYGWQSGQLLDLLLPSGETLSARIAQVVPDNPLLSEVLVSMGDYRAAGGEPEDRSVFVVFDGSRPAGETRADVEAIVAVNPLLDVFSQTEVKERNTEQLNQLLYLILGMLALSVIIAGLGVVNTTGLAVVERTGEIGLLRAVGASRRQIRRMIRWEAVLVSTLGGLLGIAVGVPAAAGLVRSLADSGLEVLSIPWDLLVIVFLAALVIGAVAAALPARSAARRGILEAIAQE